MSTLSDLPPLRDVIAAHDLSAKKSLGQNYLLDLNLTLKIANSGGSLENVTVIEIGPGPGGLTRSLLSAGAKKVIAIERDQRFLPALEEISQVTNGQLEVINDDALRLDFGALATSIDDGSTIKIIANLPYNIATQLLINWISTKAWPPFYQSMTLMFQKEVAQRICAQPGSKAYGRLAIMAGWRCYCEISFDVAPTAFVPPPKVTSSILNLVPKPEPLACSGKKLEQVTRAAFGQRRKMLRASLKSMGGDKLLERAGIDGKLRAEVLSIEDFVTLANLI